MSTPNRPHLGPGGEHTHAAMMSALTPDAPAVLDRLEAQVADLDQRVGALEAAHTDAPGEELA